jgi:hypothetical protein
MKTRKLWAGLVLLAGLLELIGLRSKAKDDTLSEYVWSKTKHPAVLIPAGALVGWLPYHFTLGNGIPLSRWDLVFAGTGAALGVAAWLVRRGRA